MSKLRLPHEGQGTLNLVGDQLSNDVSGVDIDGTNCHDLLTIAACQGSQQQGDLKINKTGLKHDYSLSSGGVHFAMSLPYVISFKTCHE